MIYQNFRFMAIAAILLGLSNLTNLYNHLTKNSNCQFTSIHHCLIIHARMSSPFPPRATSSLNLPVHQLLAPPALPSYRPGASRAAAATANLPPPPPPTPLRRRTATAPPPSPRCHRLHRRAAAASAAKLPASAALLPAPARCHRLCRAAINNAVAFVIIVVVVVVIATISVTVAATSFS